MTNNLTALAVINNQRAKIQQIVNDGIKKSTTIEDVKELQKIFYRLVSIVDASSMFEILSMDEREVAYNNLVDFFSGIPASLVYFPPLNSHKYDKENIIDFRNLQKIMAQETLNANFKNYREYTKDKPYQKSDCLFANIVIADFAKEFSILNEEELTKLNTIIKEYQKNKIKSDDIYFVPKTLYNTTF